MNYLYNIEKGVSRVKTNTKKYIAGILAGVGVVAVVSGTVLAAGNSTSGIDRYIDNPGRQQATEVGAQCGSGAGSGAFGYFGKDNNLAGGANGEQTGLNNSSVCGNR